jgi:hypothetical protein
MSTIPPSVAIQGLLVDLGIADQASPVTGWDCFAGYKPHLPARLIAVLDTPGGEPETRFAYERPRVQVFVRGEIGDWQAAYEKVTACFDALQATSALEPEYPLVRALQGPMHLETDDFDRPVWVFNLELARTR